MGKTIADKIKTEMNSEITGEKCNVFKRLKLAKISF